MHKDTEKVKGGYSLGYLIMKLNQLVTLVTLVEVIEVFTSYKGEYRLGHATYTKDDILSLPIGLKQIEKFSVENNTLIIFVKN